MKSSNVRNAGSIVQVLILGVIVLYGRTAHLILPGIVYLLAAGYLSLHGLLIIAKLRPNQGRGTAETTWSVNARANIFVVSALQMAIIGSLNVWSQAFSGTAIEVTFGYLSVGLFVVLSYKMVARADSSDQEGGSSPMIHFGHPRSRKLLFSCLVYAFIIPLAIVSLAWWRHEWCPVLLKPPQLWLLQIAFLAVLSAGLAFQRYRRALPDKRFGIRVLIATICVLGCTTGIWFVFLNSAWGYMFSAFAAASIAAEVYWLSLAKEPGSPRQAHSETSILGTPGSRTSSLGIS
jgi:hypothetical protein